MTAVTLACPHCAGNIQVDTDYAGQQVGCPLCNNALMLPPAEVMAQFLAAAAPAYQPPPQEPVFMLGCPVCSNPLQVTAAMSGHQVGCPSCNTPIMVPPLSWPGAQPDANPYEVAAEAVTEQALAVQPELDINSMLPPGAAPLPVPPSEIPPPTVPHPAPTQRQLPPRDLPSREPPTRSQPTATPSRPGADRMPPGADRMPPARGGSSDAPKSPAAESPRGDRFPPVRDRMPPGADRMPPGLDRMPPRRDATLKADDKLPPASSESAAPKADDRLPPPRRVIAESPPKPSAEAHSRPATPGPSIPPAPVVDDRLPPGAPAASPQVEASLPDSRTADIDAFLPPGATTAMTTPETHLPQPIVAPAVPSPVDQLLPPGATDLHTAAIGQPTPMRSTGIADSLLPPGVSASHLSKEAPGAEVALPKSAGGPLRPVLAPGQPTAKPGPGSLQTAGREGKRPRNEEEPEVRKLSDEERSKRRFRRNAVMCTILLIILFAVFYWMAR